LNDILKMFVNGNGPAPMVLGKKHAPAAGIGVLR